MLVLPRGQIECPKPLLRSVQSHTACSPCVHRRSNETQKTNDTPLQQHDMNTNINARFPSQGLYEHSTLINTYAHTHTTGINTHINTHTNKHSTITSPLPSVPNTLCVRMMVQAGVCFHCPKESLGLLLPLFSDGN